VAGVSVKVLGLGKKFDFCQGSNFSSFAEGFLTEATRAGEPGGLADGASAVGLQPAWIFSLGFSFDRRPCWW